MKTVFELDVDLPGIGVMGPAEGSAIVQQKPPVGQIERGQRDRKIIRYRLAYRQIESRVSQQVCRDVARTIGKPGAVVKISATRSEKPSRVDAFAGWFDALSHRN